MGKNRKGGAKKKGRGRSNAINPSPLALAYRGPITPNVPGMLPIVRMQTYAATISSNALGSIIANVVVAASVVSEWATMAGLYREYRILGATCKWVPNFTGYSTASTPPLSSMAVFTMSRDPSISLPATVLQALQINPRVIGNISNRLRLTYRMSGATEAAWHNTDSPAVGVASFTLNCDLLTVSSAYGTLQMDVMMQYRNPW